MHRETNKNTTSFMFSLSSNWPQVFSCVLWELSLLSKPISCVCVSVIANTNTVLFHADSSLEFVSLVHRCRRILMEAVAKSPPEVAGVASVLFSRPDTIPALFIIVLSSWRCKHMICIQAIVIMPSILNYTSILVQWQCMCGWIHTDGFLIHFWCNEGHSICLYFFIIKWTAFIKHF